MSERTKPRRATWGSVANDPQGAAQDVLNRLRENHESGKGINLTAAELHALSVTQIGAYWTQDDPRPSPGQEE